MTLQDPTEIAGIQREWYAQHPDFDISTCEDTDRFIAQEIEGGENLRDAVFAGMKAWAASLPRVEREGFSPEDLIARYDDKSEAVNYAARHGLRVVAEEHTTEDRDVYFVVAD